MTLMMSMRGPLSLATVLSAGKPFRCRCDDGERAKRVRAPPRRRSMRCLPFGSERIAIGRLDARLQHGLSKPIAFGPAAVAGTGAERGFRQTDTISLVAAPVLGGPHRKQRGYRSHRRWVRCDARQYRTPGFDRRPQQPYCSTRSRAESESNLPRDSDFAGGAGRESGGPGIERSGARQNFLGPIQEKVVFLRARLAALARRQELSTVVCAGVR